MSCFHLYINDGIDVLLKRDTLNEGFIKPWLLTSHNLLFQPQNAELDRAFRSQKKEIIIHMTRDDIQILYSEY